MDYIEINKKLWNDKTEVHLKSKFYDVDRFVDGKSSLNDIELGLLGDVSGKKILHLQCHFGQDTISLARLGAEVTGVDFSEKAIESAHELARKTKSNTRFVCCNLYDLNEHLNEKFDIVFTSYGTIGWLPDINKWAKLISSFLKPGGKFVFVEFHPVIWMFDNDFTKIEYNYFNVNPIIEVSEGTYADKSAPIKNQSIGWNHDLAEVVGNLLKQNLEIKSFNEYDYSPYNCLNNMEEFAPGKFRIKHFQNKIPVVYSVVAAKK